MRRVFFAGLILAVVFLLVNFAIRLLDVPNDWSVMAGYFLLLALVAVLSGVMHRIGRRL
jgi:hypothetical protein